MGILAKKDSTTTIILKKVKGRNVIKWVSGIIKKLNKMESKHTKSEWIYSEPLSAIVTVRNHKVLCIADFGRGDISGEECEANANHIVKCVNSHEELVKVLHNCVITLETINALSNVPIAETTIKEANEALKKLTDNSPIKS